MERLCWITGFLAALPIHAKADEAAYARQYIIETSRPGFTMTAQGPWKATECLQPKFAIALAAAIKEARASGLPDTGVFSACRPTIFGIGGFNDKSLSLHTYGLAVDLMGIGRPGSTSSILWNAIAKRHGLVNPYGPSHGAEWNHYQASSTREVKRGSLIRTKVTETGPKDYQELWEAGQEYLSKRLRLAVLPSPGDEESLSLVSSILAAIEAPEPITQMKVKSSKKKKHAKKGKGKKKDLKGKKSKKHKAKHKRKRQR